MFSSRAPRLLGAALMDLAEAMLRPVDDWEQESALADAGATRSVADGAAISRPAEQPLTPAADLIWLDELEATEPASSTGCDPHRRTSRLERRRRRPGAIARAPQPCTSPVPPRRPRGASRPAGV